jgi:hypothetical protein
MLSVVRQNFREYNCSQIIRKKAFHFVIVTPFIDLTPARARRLIMKLIVRKYYSGFCTFEIDADGKDKAYEVANGMTPKYDEILSTLEPCEDCDEIELVKQRV